MQGVWIAKFRNEQMSCNDEFDNESERDVWKLSCSFSKL